MKNVNVTYKILLPNNLKINDQNAIAKIVMIKLKDILLEGMSKNKIMDVVKKVYPQIVKDLGGKALPIEVYSSIWNRVDAVGAEELMEDDRHQNRYQRDTGECRPMSEMGMKCEWYWTTVNEKKENK